MLIASLVYTLHTLEFKYPIFYMDTYDDSLLITELHDDYYQIQP